jgi:hypothetical protein
LSEYGQGGGGESEWKEGRKEEAQTPFYMQVGIEEEEQVVAIS